MTKDEILKEIENALNQQKLAEVRVKILTLQLRFQSKPTLEFEKEQTNHYLKYCKTNKVNPEDKELILRKSLSKEEVALELGESTSKVYRLLKRGVLKHATDSRDRRIRICTISVYEYLQFGYGKSS